MFCKECGSQVDGAKFCSNCGTNVDYTKTDDSSYNDNQPAGNNVNEEREILKVLISKNVGYYMKQFDKIERGEKSFNWSVCFFSGIVLLYRKQYRYFLKTVLIPTFIPLIVMLILIVVLFLMEFTKYMSGMEYLLIIILPALLIYSFVMPFICAKNFNKQYRYNLINAINNNQLTLGNINELKNAELIRKKYNPSVFIFVLVIMSSFILTLIGVVIEEEYSWNTDNSSNNENILESLYSKYFDKDGYISEDINEFTEEYTEENVQEYTQDKSEVTIGVDINNCINSVKQSHVYDKNIDKTFTTLFGDKGRWSGEIQQNNNVLITFAVYLNDNSIKYSMLNMTLEFIADENNGVTFNLGNVTYWYDNSNETVYLKTWEDLNDFIDILSESASFEDDIIGLWHNGETEWASSYHTQFYSDGTVEFYGYRNKDYGSYTIIDNQTVVAVFNLNYMNISGYGYVLMDGYTYTATYKYDSKKDELTFTALGYTEGNASDGRLKRTDSSGSITNDFDYTYGESYILMNSDNRYLSYNDLYGLTANELRLARNEIYARHGRLFTDSGIQEYFNSCSWYIGYITATEFKESMLNDYEIANKDLIVQYEKDMGYR